MSLLKDSKRDSGFEYPEFVNAVRNMEGATKSVTALGGDITFLSYCNIPELEEPGKTLMYVYNSENLEAFQKGGKLPVGRINNADFGEELLEEMKKTTELMVIINGEKYLVSDIAIPTMTIRADVGGSMTIMYQNMIRNMHFADTIIAKKEQIMFIYREEEITTPTGPVTVKKIFGCLSKDYRKMPQSVLIDAIGKIDDGVMGKYRCREWSVDHKFTDIYLDFPEAAEDFQKEFGMPDKYTPGLFLCTSDIGASSVIARGCYRIGNSYLITDEVAFKHSKKTTIDEIVEAIDSGVFTNMRKLPETMSKLIGIECKQPKEMITFVANKCLKGKNLIPATRAKELAEVICFEIDDSRTYTLYDIAKIFLQIGEMTLPVTEKGEDGKKKKTGKVIGLYDGIDSVRVTAIQKALNEVPLFLEKNADKEFSKPRKIVILPD